MAELFSEMDAVRVKIKKCDSQNNAVYKKFSIDPRITSFDVLRRLVAKAFDIRGDFSLSYYLGRDDSNKPIYSALLSDWDLDAALLSSADPCLRLKVDLYPTTEGFDDWELICPVDVPVSPTPSIDTSVLSPRKTSPRGSILRSRLSSLGKSMEVLQKVFGIADSTNEDAQYMRVPMTDSAYRNFLDSEGRLVRPLELRRSVFMGGVDGHARRYVWRTLLNVFPEGLTGQQRLDYMKKKSAEYYEIRDQWKSQNAEITHQLQYITNLVRKDVLRTDRSHKFFAGADDNKNIVSLFNILTTYAMAHPNVSYCQGMSDLASPLLVVMKDEAHAYICFCGLMKRMKRNFRGDSVSISIKFQHLRRLLQHYDPEFYGYLVDNQSDDLLFCYRWLLVELKREFSFEDSLRVLEVIWASLPPDPPETELDLKETSTPPDATDLFDFIDYRTKQEAPSHVSKSSSGNSSGLPSKRGSGAGGASLSDADDSSSEYMLMENSITEDLAKELKCLEDAAGEMSRPESSRTRASSGYSLYSTPVKGMEDTLTDSKIQQLNAPSGVPRSLSQPFGSPRPKDDPRRRSWPRNIMDSGMTETNYGDSGLLPPPNELGDGNPFLVFICLTILLQHRDFILTNGIQHHFELAMYFDKMIKRHNLQRILVKARKLFAEYLRAQHAQRSAMESSGSGFGSDEGSEETHNS